MRNSNFYRYLKFLLLVVLVLPIAFADNAATVQSASLPDGITLTPALSKRAAPPTSIGSGGSMLENPLESPAPGRKNLAEAGKTNWTDEPVVGQEKIFMVAGNSHILRFARPLQRISISEPEVADVAIVDRTDVLINSKKRGAANLIVWDTKAQVYMYNVIITADARPLKEALSRIVDPDKVEVFPTEKGFVVKGSVNTVEEQKQVEDTAKAFSQDSVSVVKVGSAKQILLEIRFVEIDKTAGREFGVDGSYHVQGSSFHLLPGQTEIDAGLRDTDSSFIQTLIPEDGGNPLFATTLNKNSRSFTGWLEALEDKNIIKTLARPNLLARDSEEASFLVGGEFPVPIVTSNTQSVEYKEFGTRLKYKPEILKDNKIRLTVETEVSQLDFANGVTLNDFVIPALASKKTNTVVELTSGNTLVLSGLLQQKITNTEQGAPFLRAIPGLGRLFERTDNEFTTVELMIVITPRLIDAEKDAIDLNKLEVGNPIHTALESGRPPFEDPKSMAIEDVIGSLHKPSLDSKTADKRELDRKQMLAGYAAKKRAERQLRVQKDQEFFKIVDEVLYDGQTVAPSNSK